MKAKMFLTAFGLLCTLAMQAQLKGLIKKVQNKVESKVEQRIDKKVDKGIDKTLDEIEGKETQPSSTPSSSGSEETGKKSSPSMKSYAKFDFVPGEKVIYSNDFAGEQAGELATGWNSNGNGAVVTLNTAKGNWMQFYQGGTYLTDNVDSFTENFTVEFDVVPRRENEKAVFPMFTFGVLSSGDLPTNDNILVKDYSKFFAVDMKIQPNDYGGSHFHLETFANHSRYLNTDVKRVPQFENYFNKVVHFSMQIQKERLRIWMNDEKLYDLPKAIVPGTVLNQLYFRVKMHTGNDAEIGYAVTNIKIAKGLPDTRHKLVEEGKFSTTGILFEVNSATIKPESNGVLKEIADVLNKFPDIKIMIVGHTDSDGSDAANLELSKKRAEAVKQSLSSEFGVDASRMTTDGKGEKEPAGDNKTREGKSQNRRVEFIKQ